VVLDTSVLVAAIRSPTGASMALVERALLGDLEIVVSTALVLEYESVLTRNEHLRVAQLSIEEVDEVLDSICRTARQVAIRWHWRPQLRDPDDEMVLEAALNGSADAIVTFNRARFLSAARRFSLQVFFPSEALERIGVP